MVLVYKFYTSLLANSTSTIVVNYFVLFVLVLRLGIAVKPFFNVLMFRLEIYRVTVQPSGRP